MQLSGVLDSCELETQLNQHAVKDFEKELTTDAEAFSKALKSAIEEVSKMVHSVA